MKLFRKTSAENSPDRTSIGEKRHPAYKAYFTTLSFHTTLYTSNIEFRTDLHNASLEHLQTLDVQPPQGAYNLPAHHTFPPPERSSLTQLAHFQNPPRPHRAPSCAGPCSPPRRRARRRRDAGALAGYPEQARHRGTACFRSHDVSFADRTG